MEGPELQGICSWSYPAVLTRGGLQVQVSQPSLPGAPADSGATCQTEVWSGYWLPRPRCPSQPAGKGTKGLLRAPFPLPGPKLLLTFLKVKWTFGGGVQWG